ncbi:carbohydrate ABC transporter permease [Agromyces silvae]|uniref:carbohydrate ABC transporter permease n=1 Tax=Agromyces silvae TaxID=3388266 RepID=UPI00280C067F|nr:sugar ABC transporter permease [Agromyces protaetiae]
MAWLARMGRGYSRALGGLSRGEQALMLALPLAFFGVFFLVPNVLNLGLAFTDWSSYRDEIQFTGLENFQYLMSTDTLGHGLRVTLTYTVLVVLFQNLLGLGFALALEQSTRANRAIRALIFIPVLISPLAAGYIFRGLLAYDGVYNQILSALTGQEVRIEWLGSVEWTLVIVAAIHAWKFFGLTTLFYIAGLSTVPGELTEAARLDGAGYWQTFFRIKWRMISAAVTINVALAFIGTLNSFEVILATTGGGPARATEVLNIYVFQEFGNGVFGRATAMTLVLFLTVLVLAVPLISFLRRREVQA